LAASLDYNSDDLHEYKTRYIKLHNTNRGTSHTYGTEGQGARFFSVAIDLLDTDFTTDLSAVDFKPGCIVEIVFTPALRVWGSKWTLYSDLLMVVKHTNVLYKAVLDSPAEKGASISPKKVPHLVACC